MDKIDSELTPKEKANAAERRYRLEQSKLSLYEQIKVRAEQAEAERDAALARVAELEGERAEIGKASISLVDELIVYLGQNPSAHKEALAGLKTARALLSKEPTL